VKASIDLGSNTIRLLIAQIDTAQTPPWKVLHYHHHIARLGEGVRASGLLSAAGMMRALSAVNDLVQRCHRFGVAAEDIYATATAAVRQSENGREFCQQVKESTGVAIRILDGNEEATLALRGSRSVLETEVANNMLLFDIGGASTEFIRVMNGKMVDVVSLPLGVIRLVEEGLKHDPPSADDWATMRQCVDQALHAVVHHWQDNPQLPLHLVGTAGTVTTLAATALAMTNYDANIINHHWMSRPNFNTLRLRLCAMRHAQRQAIPSIEKGRADLIVAGTAIVDAIFSRWNYQTLRCVDAGLMEGVLAEAIQG